MRINGDVKNSLTLKGPLAIFVSGFLRKLQFVGTCLNAIGYRFVGQRRGYFFATSLNDPPA